MNSCRPNSFKFFNKSLKKKISTYTYSMCELFCLNEFYINKSKSVAPGTILDKVVKNVRLGYKAGLSTIKILISLMRGKVSMDQSPLKPCFCPDATGQSSLPCSLKQLFGEDSSFSFSRVFASTSICPSELHNGLF